MLLQLSQNFDQNTNPCQYKPSLPNHTMYDHTMLSFPSVRDALANVHPVVRLAKNIIRSALYISTFAIYTSVHWFVYNISMTHIPR